MSPANFNQEEFDQFILDNYVVGFFSSPVKLKSGRSSNWYVNWRNVAEDVFLLDKLTDDVISFTKDLGLKPDCFYGVPEGATKMGIITQYKWAKDPANDAPLCRALPMGRGKPKEYGEPKDKYFVGEPKGKTIVLEDVTTTGSSLLTTIDQLTEAKIFVIAAFGLTNRMELRDDRKSVLEAVSSRNVPYHALSNALQLLPKAYKRYQILNSALNPEQIAKSVEEEFEKYGVEKLKL